MGVFSDSIRVQEQAYSRAARQGEPGSAQFIINKQHLVKFECTDHVNCLKEEREKKEAESLARSFWCRIPYIQIQDDLFNAYVELVKEANSPTGYNLMIGRPADWPLSFCMYLYTEGDQIVLKIIDQESVAKRLNMTAQLADLDPIAHKHIKTILADPQAASSSLSYYRLYSSASSRLDHAGDFRLSFGFVSRKHAGHPLWPPDDNLTYTGYQAISNAYTFYQEQQGTSAYQHESLRAYGELSKKLVDSLLQGVYDFSPWVADYQETLDHQVEINEEGAWDQGEDWSEALWSTTPAFAIPAMDSMIETALKQYKAWGAG